MMNQAESLFETKHAINLHTFVIYISLINFIAALFCCIICYHAVKVKVPSFLDDTTMQNAQVAMIERSESVGIVIATNHIPSHIVSSSPSYCFSFS